MRTPRQVLTQRALGDDGSALLASVAVAFIVLALGAATSIGVLASDRASGIARQRTQALAGAESGLDIAVARINAANQRNQESTLPCGSATTDIPATPDPMRVTYTVTYVDIAGAPLPLPPAVCPLSNGSRPAQATVTSRAVPTRVLAGAGSTGARSMTTTVALTAGAASSAPVFTKGVFSDGPLSVTNTFSTVGGSVYSNDDYSCNSDGVVDGTVTVQGDVRLTNSCKINGNVFSGGNFSCSGSSPSPIVLGSVRASGTTGSSLTNSCNIKGNLWTGGPVTLTATPKIEGNLITSTLGLTTQSTARVLGDTRTGGAITVSDGQPKTVPLRGLITDNSPQALPPGPPVETMPPVTYRASDWTGFTVRTWAQWVAQNANDNGAPSYSGARTNPCDQISGAGYSLNGPLRNSGDLVVDATACTGVRLLAVTLRLSGDLTIFVKDFSSSNGLTVTSADGDVHKLRIIVPASNTSNVCASTSSSGDIVFNSGGTVISNKTPLLLYTPGRVELTNEVDFYGSIYACRTNWSVDTTVRYLDVTPLGGVTDTWTAYAIKDVGPRYESTSG
jgi:Tfp pilus assembly protein PilX